MKGGCLFATGDRLFEKVSRLVDWGRCHFIKAVRLVALGRCRFPKGSRRFQKVGGLGLSGGGPGAGGGGCFPSGKRPINPAGRVLDLAG